MCHLCETRAKNASDQELNEIRDLADRACDAMKRAVEATIGPPSEGMRFLAALSAARAIGDGLYETLGPEMQRIADRLTSELAEQRLARAAEKAAAGEPGAGAHEDWILLQRARLARLRGVAKSDAWLDETAGHLVDNLGRLERGQQVLSVASALKTVARIAREQALRELGARGETGARA
jgi:hypothetical protein